MARDTAPGTNADERRRDAYKTKSNALATARGTVAPSSSPPLRCAARGWDASFGELTVTMDVGVTRRRERSTVTMDRSRSSGSSRGSDDGNDVVVDCQSQTAW